MLTLPPALAALAAWPQFVCWYAEPKPDNPSKLNKFPIDWRDGSMPSAARGGIGVLNDPTAWTTAEVALAAAPRWDRGYGSGAGFVFTAQDPFWFADLDGVLQPDGQWSAEALAILARFPGAAVEVSHSGKGLHIFGRSAPIQHSNKNVAKNLELYTHGRFVALTGTNAIGDAGTEHTVALAQYAAEYFPPRVITVGGADWTDGPVADWSGPTDDDDLIRRALASGQRSAAAAFGGQSGEVAFADLWEARADALAARWPGNEGKPYDASSADQALANQLAFWTGKDCARMERLMRRSALARDKWDAHHTYLTDTITGAARFVRNVATLSAPAGVVVPPPPPSEDLVEVALHGGIELRPQGQEYMHGVEQLEHFKGCFVLTDLKQPHIYNLADDTVVTKASFDITHGGYLFVIDPTGAKTIDSAWDAYTKSRIYRPLMVNDLCFRPELASGAVITEGRRRLVNSYVPYEPRVLAGDPAPFLDLLTRLLPDERDRALLLAWMARVVQSPGHKLQWWPVIQGVQGNGKSSIVNLLAYAHGEGHTHYVNPDALVKTAGQFNDWITRRTFVVLEEVKVDDRRAFMELMKPLVTGERMAMEAKGGKQFTGDNRANGAVTTNWPAGMPIDDKERRYGMFFTAQQEAEHLERDGLTAAYFSNLRDWWRGEGAWAAYGNKYGFAVATGFLKAYQIPEEMDPRHHSRAPETTSTQEAIRQSLGRVEQEILEAVDEGRTGFAGGWVSSTYLDLLIDQQRAGVPRAKRRALMQSLGYDWHPALVGGRTNGVVMPDNKKPRLYVRKGHVAASLTDAHAVAQAYAKAQEPGAAGAVSQGAVVAFTRPAG